MSHSGLQGPSMVIDDEVERRGGRQSDQWRLSVLRRGVERVQTGRKIVMIGIQSNAEVVAWYPCGRTSVLLW